MDLAADAFEREMLAAAGISAYLGYSIGEVESKLKEFLMEQRCCSAASLIQYRLLLP